MTAAANGTGRESDLDSAMMLMPACENRTKIQEKVGKV
jgi:hypothetical protein